MPTDRSHGGDGWERDSEVVGLPSAKDDTRSSINVVKTNSSVAVRRITSNSPRHYFAGARSA
jgi:hypothetical protein